MHSRSITVVDIVKRKLFLDLQYTAHHRDDMVLERYEAARFCGLPDQGLAEVARENLEEIHLLGVVAVDFAAGVLI